MNKNIWKANHIKALETLGFKATAFNRLRALENTAHWLAERYCNGTIEEAELEKRNAGIEKAVAKLCGTLPAGFFINGDPRGYALKIDAGNGAGETPHPEYIPEGLHRDWGGYGILAPEF
jgi:hypothetical protein